MYGQDKEAPVEEGDELDLVCEGVGSKGDGVCKHEGFVVIVPGATEGNAYRVRITKVMGSFSFGELI